MATAIDASCSLLDGRPASGQGEDECLTDDETDSDSEGNVSDVDMDSLPRTARPKTGALCDSLAFYGYTSHSAEHPLCNVHAAHDDKAESTGAASIACTSS